MGRYFSSLFKEYDHANNDNNNNNNNDDVADDDHDSEPRPE